MTNGPDPVRVGVLGAGAIAQIAHLPLLRQMEGVTLAALADTDRNNVRTIAERFGIPRVYRSPADLWADQEVDAVIIATPSHLHEQQTCDGLQSGKFILCEKPLALSAEGAERVLQTPGAEQRLMVGMNQRYRPDAADLKTFLSGGELGEAFYLRAAWLNRPISAGRRNWRQRRARAGGGVLMDLGVQMLDLALWLLSYPEPDRVVAHVRRPTGAEVEDAAVLLAHFRTGQVINLEVTWNLLAERERQYLHITASAGAGSLSPLTVTKEVNGSLVNVTPPVVPHRENLYTASYREEIYQFLRLVRGERQASPPREQITLMRLVDAAYRSAAEQREVVLGDS